MCHFKDIFLFWVENREGRGDAGGEWKVVEGATAAERAAMRFFKVVVEVP